MRDEQKTTDGEPLYDRGTIENDENRQPPVDETDMGPQPVIVGKNDAEPRNTNEEPHPTIDAEDAKDA